MKESVDELRLKLHRNAPDHAEIEKRESAVSHHAKVSGMRVCVKESVFEQLLQVSARKQFHYLRRVVACGFKLLDVCYLQPFDELHDDEPVGRKYFVNCRDVDLFPVLEVLAKHFGVSSLLAVIHLFKD